MATPVQRHIECYAASNGIDLTKESMTQGHTAQGITEKVWLKVWAIINMLSPQEPTVANLCPMRNPAATGIWGTNGQVDQARLAQIVARAIDDKGKKILTKTIVDDWLKGLHGKKDHGVATYLGYAAPVTWWRVTDGSIGELFRYYTDHTYTNKKGQAVPALTVERFTQFYTHPKVVWKQRVNEGSEQKMRSAPKDETKSDPGKKSDTK